MTPSDSSASTRSLALAAMGVIFGDIGTSPLYTMRVAFNPEGGLALTPETLFGVLSLIFWSILIVVTAKYIMVMLRFDYLGEGGVLALLSLTLQKVSGSPALGAAVTGLGMLAASLFFGDAMITPAMSLLAAVEGITVVAPALHAWVVPIAMVILVTLFGVQKRGTASVGRVFGPVMLAWFVVLGLMGVSSVVQAPEILYALHPKYALWFFTERPGLVVIAMGAVFLCVTGAEAMYADLGHFGRKPIRLAWFSIVLPCLMLNYLGQGALLLRQPAAAVNPFFLLAPELLRVPLIVLATAATIIASQAVISGAFSVSQQASRLNLLPRLKVLYTSETARGQVYVPVVNTVLMIAVLLLVVGFRSSDNLAAAYGLAVSGDLVIGSVLLGVVVIASGRGRLLALLPLLALFLSLELVFFFANATKFADGGWFPVGVATVIAFVMSTWRGGLDSLRIKKDLGPKAVIDGLALDLSDVHRVPGTAVFFCSAASGCPSSFLHNLKHNKVVHEQTYFLTVDFDDIPRVPDEDRLAITRGQNGIYRLVARFGYREDPDISMILRLVRERGLEVHEDFASFFTSKPVIVSVAKRGFFRFRRKLFGWMLQNSPSVASYLRLPPNRVIELGAQVAI
ncbi:MAG: potassium transporter Kup [Lautropia sp.]